MFLHNQLPAQRNHKKHAEPAAKKSEREDSPEGELRAEAKEDQRRESEHDAGGERFSRRAGGLDDVVFQDGGAPECPQDADGENGDRN